VSQHFLSVDVGGTGIKALLLDGGGDPLGEPLRQPTPKPATPEAVLAVIEGLVSEFERYDRVAVGFPGIVLRGVTQSAPNLDDASWHGFDLVARMVQITGKPTRVLNDVDLQGFGVIEAHGTEMVLTFGTGMGAAIYTDGHLVPNLELGHHPFGDGRTYEDRVCDAELKRVGAEEWTERVHATVRQILPIWNPDVLFLGGGNLRHLTRPLPPPCRLFSLEQGMAGVVRVWQHS